MLLIFLLCVVIVVLAWFLLSEVGRNERVLAEYAREELESDRHFQSAIRELHEAERQAVARVRRAARKE